MPKLNTANPEVQDFTKHLLGKIFDIDACY